MSITDKEYIRIILKGKPKSTQWIYAQSGRIRFMKKEAKALKEYYSLQAKQQWKGKPITGLLEVMIRVFYYTKRRIDWDNWHKLSMDSLTGIVWEDDSQIRKATVILGYDKNDPRIEIEIKNYPF